MVLQRTRFERLQRHLGDQIQPAVHGPWRRRSVEALVLLLGFVLGNNLSTYYLEKLGQRPFVALALVLLIELTVRCRTRVTTTPWPLAWRLVDNLRVGVLYAVVFEAYKVGS
ncbi:MAG: DUF565 domain-containing protein [Synechococcus sp.]